MPNRARPPLDGLPVVSTPETLGSSQVREQNSAMLLRVLWCAKEISRAELSRQTGLSRSTISAIVTGLLETGLVAEARVGESRGGRKPIMLGFQDDAYYIVGVDMGATHIAVGVTNLRGQIRAWRTQSHNVRNSPRTALQTLFELIDDAVNQAGAAPERVLGIGVAVPSPVDPAAPGQLLPLLVPKWADHDLEAALHARYDLPVFIDNDANLGALAEVWWGGHPAPADLAFIKVGFGVGAGLIINGRVHRGRSGTAGEIGHVSLDPSGPRCVCGLNGCINTLIGSKNLVDRARSQLDVYPDSALHGRKRMTVEHVVDAALAGDPLARDVVSYAARTLGVGVANLLNLLAPQVVVLGGAMTRAGELLLEPLERTVSGISLANSVMRVQILISQLGERGVAQGAATMVLEAALDDPRYFEDRRRQPA